MHERKAPPDSETLGVGRGAGYGRGDGSRGCIQKGGAGAVKLHPRPQRWTEDEGDEGLQRRGWCTPYSHPERPTCR